MRLIAAIITFLLLCACVKKENPYPLMVEKKAVDTSSRNIFVSGFSRWGVITSEFNSTVFKVNCEKDSIFVEISVNRKFKTGYLAIPNCFGGFHKLMLYSEGKYVAHAIFYDQSYPPYAIKPTTIFSALSGDSIQVKAIYKPFKLFRSDDMAKMVQKGLIASTLDPLSTKGVIYHTPTKVIYSTADTVSTGRFEYKRWRETSTASETCVAISLSGIVK